MILEPWNHQESLIDSMTNEPYPMELVGDFWIADPIFKGSYGDSLLYSDVELCRLRQRGIHLPTYHRDIPMPLAPSYQQAREPKVSKQSPPWVVAPDTAVESPKTKHSSSNSSPDCNWDTAPTPQLQSTQTLLQPRNPPAPKGQPQTARRSLQRLAALTSMAVPLPQSPSQLDTNGKMFTRRTPAHSTPLFPSAPACLTASAVQQVPTVT